MKFRIDKVHFSPDHSHDNNTVTPSFLSSKPAILFQIKIYTFYHLQSLAKLFIYYTLSPSPLSITLYLAEQSFDNRRTVKLAREKTIDVQRSTTTTWQSFHVKSKLESSWEQPADLTITSQRHCRTTWINESRFSIYPRRCVIPNFALLQSSLLVHPRTPCYKIT